MHFHTVLEVGRPRPGWQSGPGSGESSDPGSQAAAFLCESQGGQRKSSSYGDTDLP